MTLTRSLKTKQTIDDKITGHLVDVGMKRIAYKQN